MCAASTRLRLTSATACSASSRGCVVSLHHVLKLLLMPCGVQSSRRSWHSLTRVLLLSDPRPVGDGDICSEPSTSCRASVSTATPRGQRDAVLALDLHAFRRYGPDALLKIDVGPTSESSPAGSTRR